MTSAFHHPTAYDEAFNRADSEELSFYGAFFPQGSRLLSLGSGSGTVECALAQAYGFRILGVDASAEMVAQAIFIAAKLPEPKPRFTVCRLPDLPVEEPPFDGAISPLLSLNYLTAEADWKALLASLATALKPGALVLMDVLLHAKPRRYQGLIERGTNHQFEFYDMLEEGRFFSVISTELRYGKSTEEPSRVKAPMAILQPEQFSQWVNEETAFQLEAYFAAHDLNTCCALPPEDARRGVCALRKI